MSQPSPMSQTGLEQNKMYFRSLADLENTPEFEQFLQREFPQAAAEFPEGVSRRRWIQLMGASLRSVGSRAVGTIRRRSRPSWSVPRGGLRESQSISRPILSGPGAWRTSCRPMSMGVLFGSTGIRSIRCTRRSILRSSRRMARMRSLPMPVAMS